MSHFGLPIREALKILGYLIIMSCATLKNSMRKHMVLEIVKYSPKFANLKNADVTVHTYLVSLEIKAFESKAS